MHSKEDAPARIVEAMTSFPYYVGGAWTITTPLMQAFGGDLLAKEGAEGFYAMAVAPSLTDRLDVAEKIEIELVIQRRVDGVCRRDKQKRVAVGCRLGGEVGADDAAGAAAVIDEDLLAEPFAELVGDDAADHVVAAAGRERDDHADRAARIIVRGGRPGESRQREQKPNPCNCNPANSRHVRPPET